MENLPGDAIGRKPAARGRAADAWVDGDAPADQFELVLHQPAETGIAIGVVHGTDEVEPAGLDPLGPILGDRLAAGRLRPEHGRRDLERGPKLLRFLMHAPHEP